MYKELNHRAVQLRRDRLKSPAVIINYAIDKAQMQAINSHLNNQKMFFVGAGVSDATLIAVSAGAITAAVQRAGSAGSPDQLNSEYMLSYLLAANPNIVLGSAAKNGCLENVLLGK
jgi:hypothetical protein